MSAPTRSASPPTDAAFHNAWMRPCIELAKTAAHEGQYPLGALVLSRDGKVLGAAGSTLRTSIDPAAHPELTALRTACDQVRSRYLDGAVLYTTLEPCPMCTAAAVFARLAGIVFGASQQDALEAAPLHPHPDLTWRQIAVPAATVAAAERPVPLDRDPVHVTGGVLAGPCRALLALAARLYAAPGQLPG
ncbi:MAG: nucleoside deaminase, partial [Streptomycetaceae bacterium]|nr:nucleoside deaminase [Streptomycetaceae bacterium]